MRRGRQALLDVTLAVCPVQYGNRQGRTAPKELRFGFVVIGMSTATADPLHERHQPGPHPLDIAS